MKATFPAWCINLAAVIALSAAAAVALPARADVSHYKFGRVQHPNGGYTYTNMIIRKLAMPCTSQGACGSPGYYFAFGGPLFQYPESELPVGRPFKYDTTVLEENDPNGYAPSSVTPTGPTTHPRVLKINATLAGESITNPDNAGQFEGTLRPAGKPALRFWSTAYSSDYVTNWNLHPSASTYIPGIRVVSEASDLEEGTNTALRPLLECSFLASALDSRLVSFKNYCTIEVKRNDGGTMEAWSLPSLSGPLPVTIIITDYGIKGS